MQDNGRVKVEILDVEGSQAGSIRGPEIKREWRPVLGFGVFIPHE